jgi:hypothetical protein
VSRTIFNFQSNDGGRAVTSVVLRILFIFNGRTGFAFYLESFPDLSFSLCLYWVLLCARFGFALLPNSFCWFPTPGA